LPAKVSRRDTAVNQGNISAMRAFGQEWPDTRGAAPL